MNSRLIFTLVAQVLMAGAALSQDGGYMEYENGIAIGMELLETSLGPETFRTVPVTVEANPRTNIYTTRDRFVPIVFGYGPDPETAESACIEVAELESERRGLTFLDNYDPSEWCIHYSVLHREYYADGPCVAGTIFVANAAQRDLGYGELHRQGSFGAVPTGTPRGEASDRAAVERFVARPFVEIGHIGPIIIVSFCWAGHD